MNTSPTPATPSPAKRPYLAIAKMIARDLFTEGGSGKHADRLLQMHGPTGKEKSGAGWSEGPLADRIEMILRNEASKGNLP